MGRPLEVMRERRSASIAPEAGQLRNCSGTRPNRLASRRTCQRDVPSLGDVADIAAVRGQQRGQGVAVEARRRGLGCLSVRSRASRLGRRRCDPHASERGVAERERRVHPLAELADGFGPVVREQRAGRGAIEPRRGAARCAVRSAARSGVRGPRGAGAARAARGARRRAERADRGEPAEGDAGREVLAGRRRDAEIDLDRRGPADRHDLALLDYVEQRRLRLRRELGDLVEKQGAAVAGAAARSAPARRGRCSLSED